MPDLPKTNACRQLDALGIRYEVRSYDVDEEDLAATSVAAKVGSMHLAGYAASKHGMLGLTRSAAIELGAHGITVNAICPNHVTTGLGSVQNEYRSRQRGQSVDEYLAEMRSRIPLGRVGWAEDTAKACAFLCSDEACYVTAEAMNVSGGQEMH
jgi:meso-butanediol dehydrogenase/(S,S)-butanediol dehydrogenase/diacetyl reductase